MHYEHLVDGMFLLKNQAFPFTEAIICVMNLLMLQLRISLSQMSHLRAFFCRKCRIYALFCHNHRDNVLFGVECSAEIWQKFSEILRILPEILSKKLAGVASAATPRQF